MSPSYMQSQYMSSAQQQPQPRPGSGLSHGMTLGTSSLPTSPMRSSKVQMPDDGAHLGAPGSASRLRGWTVSPQNVRPSPVVG
jgi:hypothetical protein